MLAAKNFNSGMQMVRQLEFSLFDFRIHREYDPGKGGRVYPILDEVRKQVAVLQPPAFNRFAHSFSHIFVGGYAAGYYSYKWAEVLSADAFSLFEERGIFDRKTGDAFLHNVLEAGGSKDAMELFVAFRGREPRIDALLPTQWDNTIMKQTPLTIALLCALLLSATTVQGAFITDRLVAGLYSEPDITNRAIKALTSGTPLHIIERKKPFPKYVSGTIQRVGLRTVTLVKRSPHG